MTNDLKKKQVILALTAAALAGVLGYGLYTAMGVVSSNQGKYGEKSKELASLEEKQKQAKNIQEELEKNKAEIDAIKQALIEQTYENKLALLIDIENTAKNSGLGYDLSIGKEMTAESIAEEKAREARTRRKSQQIREEAREEEFPSIVFNAKLSGSFPQIVNFIERLQALSYYTRVDNFNIASKRTLGEGGSGQVEANVQFSVFTK